jgi:DNA-binding beta-propeller fold protein YncE
MFVVPGSIAKLASDPSRCFLYELDTSSPSSIVVIDTGTKREFTRVILPGVATDMDISPDGRWLVAAMEVTNQIVVVDKDLWVVAQATDVAASPFTVEVSNAGLAYYAERESAAGVRRVDLQVGSASEVALKFQTPYWVDIELGPEGQFIYRGHTNTSGGQLEKYDVTVTPPVRVGRTIWHDAYAANYPARHVYLGASGKHLYYASYSIDVDNPAFVRGLLAENVLVEDKAGTFAVGSSKIFDAALVRTIGSLPKPSYLLANSAALTSNDGELWYNVPNREIHSTYYANVLDFLEGKALGVRNLGPEPVANYTITKLVADPVRPRLYGLDATRELIVAIDTATKTAIGAIIAGTFPNDIAVDASGSYLYVGHGETLAVAQIDLASWKFARYIPTPRLSYEVEVLGNSRLAVIDMRQWTTPTLLDVATGNVLHSVGLISAGALAATSDGDTVFVGETNSSSEQIIRYSVGSGSFVEVTRSLETSAGTRRVVVTPDGTGVYYAGMFLDGTNLTVAKYAQPDEIVSITPNGLLAASASNVYRVSDGMLRGALPVSGAVQAASPNSTTLYVLSGPAISAVDLTTY